MHIPRTALLAFVTACCSLAVGAGAAKAAPTTIDFESLSGPSFFCPPPAPLQLGVATFSGGVIMSAVSGLPANQSTVYGTASFCSGYERSITITFSRPVSNFSTDVLNGDVTTVSYTVRSNTGASETKSLEANFESGAGRFTLSDSGITSVTISTTATEGFWEFFIDNVSFTVQDRCVVSGTARLNLGGGRTALLTVLADSRFGSPIGFASYLDSGAPLAVTSTQIQQLECSGDHATVRGQAWTSRFGASPFELSVTAGGTSGPSGDAGGINVGSYNRAGPAISGNLSVSQG